MTLSPSPSSSPVAIDFETALGGEPSLEFWHPDFRVVSLAISCGTFGQTPISAFVEGENECRDLLEQLANREAPIVAHNAQFEEGVLRCRFAAVAGRLRWHADTMRLVQVYDGGGDGAFAYPASLDDQLDSAEVGDIEPESIDGLGLDMACRRILREPSIKEPFYREIRAAGAKRGKEAENLHLLPSLKDYNVSDSEATLRLYNFITERFRREGYDWRIDHQLYFSTLHHVVAAKIRGVPVERDRLSIYRGTVAGELQRFGDEFRERYEHQILAVERQRLLDGIRKRKTLRGRRRFVAGYRAGNAGNVRDVRFNVGSNKQLASLFVDQLGIRPKFFTATGQPAFKSSMLSQWGEGGELLKTRRKRLLVLKQSDALLALSAFDGRWHLDMKLAGTATGRLAGGSHE